MFGIKTLVKAIVTLSQAIAANTHVRAAELANKDDNEWGGRLHYGREFAERHMTYCDDVQRECVKLRRQLGMVEEFWP